MPFFHWSYKTRNISQLLSYIYNLYHENVKLLKAHWSSDYRLHGRNFITRKMVAVSSSANEPAPYQNAGNRRLSTTCCESMKIYTDWSVLCKRNVFPVMLELRFNFSSHGSTALAGLDRPPWGSSITLRHITSGRTPLHEWSARHRDLNRPTRNTHKRQTSMSTAEFAPAIPSHRPQTHALDRATNGIGWRLVTICINFSLQSLRTIIHNSKLRAWTAKELHTHYSPTETNITRALSPGAETLQVWTALLVAGSIHCISGERIAPGSGP